MTSLQSTAILANHICQQTHGEVSIHIISNLEAREVLIFLVQEMKRVKSALKKSGDPTLLRLNERVSRWDKAIS